MDIIENKSKVGNRIFYTVLILLILGSVITTFYKIVIQKNYQIEAETSCDPQTEKCFVYTCDPTNDETCPINESERISYYKMINKKASNIALCQTTAEKIGCDTELSCTQGETDCSYTFCDESSLSEGEACSSTTP